MGWAAPAVARRPLLLPVPVALAAAHRAAVGAPRRARATAPRRHPGRHRRARLGDQGPGGGPGPVAMAATGPLAELRAGRRRGCASCWPARRWSTRRSASSSSDASASAADRVASNKRCFGARPSSSDDAAARSPGQAPQGRLRRPGTTTRHCAAASWTSAIRPSPGGASGRPPSTPTTTIAVVGNSYAGQLVHARARVDRRATDPDPARRPHRLSGAQHHAGLRPAGRRPVPHLVGQGLVAAAGDGRPVSRRVQRARGRRPIPHRPDGPPPAPPRKRRHGELRTPAPTSSRRRSPTAVVERPPGTRPGGARVHRYLDGALRPLRAPAGAAGTEDRLLIPTANRHPAPDHYLSRSTATCVTGRLPRDRRSSRLQGRPAHQRDVRADPGQPARPRPGG